MILALRRAAVCFAILCTSAPGRAQDSELGVEAASRGASSDPEQRVLLRGNHARIAFTKDVQRVAVGDPKKLAFEVLNNREILVLGSETGRTTLIAWFSDGTFQQFSFSVQPDLSVLAAALKEIHPNIVAEMAPDRDAIVLRGVVPEVSYSRAAENIAQRYLDAAKSAVTTGSEPLVQGSAVEGAAAPAAPAAADALRAPAPPQAVGKVINLIRLEKLPPRADERMRQAIEPLTGDKVTVRRIQRGAVPDDATDIFVLEGRVRDQVALVRIIAIATRVLTGQETGQDEIRIIADESGSLTQLAQGAAQTGGGGATSPTGFGNVGGSNLFSGSSGEGGATRLDNRIGFNVGRAKALEAAKGRILSFVHVVDLPQVRVDIRIYEVNRTDLISYGSDLTALASDFTQPPLSPAAGATNVQGLRAASVGGAGNTDVQNVLGFLADGITNEFQFSSSHFAIDSVLRYLETRGIARSLSGPSLTVLSGEIALFQVGGEVPVPVAFSPAFGSAATTGATTPGVFSGVEFREFGVALGVRPLVGEDDVITLDVVPQVVNPDAKLTAALRVTTGVNPQTTAFETRSLRTSARLEDGQSLLIGGLNSRKSTDSATSTPWVRDVPVLGWLFKRFSVEDEDQELVIVVNPVIVRDPLPNAELWLFPDTGELLGHCIRRHDKSPAAADAASEHATNH